MSEHAALYRKYRPQTFEEVLGQQHIVAALKGAIAQDKIAHAYLFSGTRGTGKTSLARIFAKALGTTDRDVYEIDAASNRGVDDVRALREEVNNLPFESQHKVYIVDEVHMLTKEAFNALLKTLEEPPKHAIFVLATTELHKLPDTIISRCQTYRFNKPTISTLKEMVATVAKKEGYVVDAAGADMLALFADGSYRDAHGVLQKVIATTTDKKISAEQIRIVLGAPESTVLFACIDALAKGDADKALQAVREATNQGVEVTIFLKLLLRALRAVLLIRSAPTLAASFRDDFVDTEYTALEHHASASATTIHSRLLTELLIAYRESGDTAIPTLPLELAILRVTNPSS